MDLSITVATDNGAPSFTQDQNQTLTNQDKCSISNNSHRISLHQCLSRVVIILLSVIRAKQLKSSHLIAII